jgi:hypothetical protein
MTAVEIKNSTNGLNDLVDTMDETGELKERSKEMTQISRQRQTNRRHERELIN